MIKKVAVAGAGTMGSGIALSAALGGFDVVLYDVQESMLEKAKSSIQKNVEVLVQKGKLNAADQGPLLNRIAFSARVEDVVADLVIEAIVEKLEVKESLFTTLAGLNKAETILASNTSSLSITAIQKNISNPERVAGLHYFNPAQVMKLVEVVKGERTSDAVISELLAFTRAQHKVPVVCLDSPGFIVNRVARHFYLESMHLVEAGFASMEEVDSILEATGFKMGPFKLMDMIGMDINLAVTESLYHAFDEHVRFKPSALQQNLVKSGKLGRKTGEGFYQYTTPRS